MELDFLVDLVALHLVDRQLPEPRFCARAISLEDFHDSADRQAIQRFLCRHFDELWSVEESLRTRAGVFEAQAVMQAYFAEIIGDKNCFYERSCDIARHLLDVSRGTTASTGVLLIVLVRKTGEDRQYLVLLKLDPGPSDLVGLGRGPDGAMLLDLAVHHVEMALPNTGERVLKWAILPHPTRDGIDAKVRDEQGRADTARYFMKFLGCSGQSSEKVQALGLLKALSIVAEACHPGLVYQPVVMQVLEKLDDEPLITPEVVLRKVEESGELPNFKESAFRASLEDHKAADLKIPGKTLAQTRVEYRLTNGITIRGPRAAVESLVQVRKLEAGGFEFLIQTPSFEKKYVG